MRSIKMKEITLEKKYKGNALLKILCMMTISLLIFVNIAGAAPFAYITNMGSNTTSVIDIANDTATDTVPVGVAPWGVGVSPDGSKVYVANNDSNNVSVINTTNNTVTDTVSVGINPSGVAVNPKGTRVYVANYGSSNISVIDTSNNTIIATVPVGVYPAGVAVNPTGTREYMWQAQLILRTPLTTVLSL
jgi:YVTN family beta-propeller protein